MNFSANNIAALIKGSQFPNEYIVITAHLDHVGIQNGEIYNGADDDGSGSVGILEIAEAFSLAIKDGYPPKRSILFLHVTAEENGLLGSEYYTDFDPIVPLNETMVLFKYGHDWEELNLKEKNPSLRTIYILLALKCYQMISITLIKSQ